MTLSSEPRFDTKEAAGYIYTTFFNLKNSRSTGLLDGVPTPKYEKRGRKVLYRKSTLDEWLSQFEERSSTSEGA